jgi:hypothetical protein
MDLVVDSVGCLKSWLSSGWSSAGFWFLWVCSIGPGCGSCQLVHEAGCWVPSGEILTPSLVGHRDGDACECHDLSWKNCRELSFLPPPIALWRETQILDKAREALMRLSPSWGHRPRVIYDHGTVERGLLPRSCPWVLCAICQWWCVDQILGRDSGFCS